MPTTPTIADIAQRTRSAVAAHFIGLGATCADTGLTYQPQRHAERRALTYLMSKGIVRLSQDGRHWLDRGAFDAWRKESATRTFVIAGGAVVAIAGLILWRRARKPKV